MGDFPLINASDVIVDYDDVEKKEIRLDEKLNSLGSGGSNITTDTTLTQSGQAADAKAVGDILGDIHSILKRI